MNIFARSWQGLNLSPGERAFVKLAEGWLITALLAGSAIAYQLLMSGNADYVFILRSAGGAALLTVLLAFKKYLAAQSDLPLSAASLATQITDVAIMEAQKIIPAQPPAQPQKAPQPILFPAPNTTTSINPQMPQNVNASAQQPVQQMPFPPAQPLQFPTVRNPQAIPAINLADVPEAQPDTTPIRHWGDTGIMPTV
jgi:hypothetical protein